MSANPIPAALICRYVSFDRALRTHPPPTGRVGDIWLRYDPPVLVGETLAPPRRARLLPDLLMLAALGAGVLAVAVLLEDGGGGTRGAAALALISAGLFALGNRLERRAAARRRFILHFGTETLRLDGPAGLRGRATRTVSFDAVKDLYVLVGADGRCALVAELEVTPGAPTLSTVLVDGVAPEAREELRRVWVTLRAAFGLKAPPAEG
jgi:hypothetical protein